MGLKLFRRKQHTEATRPPDMGAVSERYNEYFPRLFAYARTCVGGEMPAQDIVIQAFNRAFGHPDSADEDRFRTVLFRTARRLCRPALKQARVDDGDSLNRREREALSLVFDAGLTRDQIARLFRIRETTVSALLMSGLRKLKEQTSPAAAAAYLKLA
ncbi:MAG: sigma-70 family RNA polymerase sigma factor [Dehalococcoidia bacterium]|nr:sigma-70 family RNA polymerase sigma factor [Dehalococcoidia bacterium]